MEYSMPDRNEAFIARPEFDKSTPYLTIMPPELSLKVI